MSSHNNGGGEEDTRNHNHSSSSSSGSGKEDDGNVKKRLRDTDGADVTGESPVKKEIKQEEEEQEEEEGAASSSNNGTSGESNDTTTTNNNNNKPPRAPWFHPQVPNTAHYHCSWMHADIITHGVHAAKHGVVLTASRDGVVKFWKRQSIMAAATAASKDGSAKTSGNRNNNNNNNNTEPLEFVKAITAHAVPIVNLSVSHDQNMAATVDATGSIQFYHIALFDAPSRLALSARWPPKTATWVQTTIDQSQLLVVSTHNGPMHVVSPDGSGNGGILQTLWVHGEDTTVSAMVFNPVHSCVFSGDQRGMLQMWDTHGDYVTVNYNNEDGVSTTNTNPTLDADAGEQSSTTTVHIGRSVTARRNNVTFSSRLETHLLRMFQKETYATAMAVTPDGSHYAVYGSDQRLRLFVHRTGHLLATYDERLKIYDKQFQDKPYRLDEMEYGRRAALERELRSNQNHRNNHADPALQQNVQLQFESTEGKYVLLPTMMGIKVIDWQRHKLVKLIGTADAAQHRFLALLQCAGSAQEDAQLRLARQQQGSSSANAAQPAMSEDSGNDATKQQQRKTDALLIAWAYKSRRFFVFSHIDPTEGDSDGEEDRLVRRDHWNEQPDAQDTAAAAVAGRGQLSAKATNKRLATHAVLHTTLGDIHVQFFPQQTPKTVENFGTHAKNGYYDGLLFHRVIKGFMLQTGDPNGDGTGGESIWGGEFADEIVPGLRHDRPFTLSMANAGANTNGSQFFITTVPCPWLDGKHTVFGRVQRGMDVCTLIENVKTDDGDKPLKDVQIVSIDIM